jgi:radical SAM superfamily enzyme YgiQ (UPF0313 family)
MKILLMNPPMKGKELYTKSSEDIATKIPPLGLGYLASYLEEQNHKVKIWDGFVEPGSWEEAKNIAKNYDLLGIHVLTSFALRAYQFAEFLKKEFPDKPIVLGGCHVSALPLEAIKKPFVDYVVVGEGEISVAKLCKSLENKSSNLKKLLGIYYKDQKGNIKFNGPQPFIKNLDILPFPARHLFKWDFYKVSEVRKSSIKRDMAILTSRGCPYQCTFCSKDVTGHKMRFFSISKVISEIKHLIKEYGIEELSIWDETFTAKRERVIEFCNALKKEKINIAWTCGSRVDRVDEELLKIMKKSGCNFIAYGIESGNDKILKSISKGITKEMVRKAIKATKKAKIYVRGFFMIGVCEDTKETIIDTINFAKELDLDLANFCMLVPLPNTLDYEKACQQNNFIKEYWKFRMFPEINFINKPIYVPENMTEKELIKLKKRAYRSFYLRPKYIIKQIQTINSTKSIKRLISGAKTILNV